MKNDEKHSELRQRSKLSILLFGLGILLIFFSLFLGVKFLVRVGHRPPFVSRETNVSTLQNWMTLRYISRVYGIPENILADKLGIDEEKSAKLSVSAIAKNIGKDTEVVLGEIRIIITDFQSSTPNPPRPPSPPPN